MNDYQKRVKNPAKLETIRNNKALTFHDFDPDDRKGWLELRTMVGGMESLEDGIRLGGSEVAIIFGLSEYKSAGALFAERLFLKQDMTKMNAHMFRGIQLEDVIIDKWWRFFDPNEPTIEKLMDNSSKKKIIREAYALHSTVTNDKMPYLLANVDSLIAEETLGVLEIKSMFKTAADKYEAGVPPQYIIQAQVYMMVLELEYAEIFMLLDATEPRCIRMAANKEIQANITSRIDDFASRVQGARTELLAAGAKITEEQAWAIAAKYEPEIEETPAYIQYMKEVYKNPKGSIVATEELEEHIIAFAKGKVQTADIAKDVLTPAEAHIRSFFHHNNVDEIVTANGSKLTWRSRLSIPYKKILGL
jgi:hypothetical protein